MPGRRSVCGGGSYQHFLVLHASLVFLGTTPVQEPRHENEQSQTEDYRETNACRRQVKLEEVKVTSIVGLVDVVSSTDVGVDVRKEQHGAQGF